MDRYTSIIRYIIPGRIWLYSKLEDGYSFMIASSSLTRLTTAYDDRIETMLEYPGGPVRIIVRMGVIKDRKAADYMNDFMRGFGIGLEANFPSWCVRVITDGIAIAFKPMYGPRCINSSALEDRGQTLITTLTMEPYESKIEYMFVRKEGIYLIRSRVC